MASDYLQQRTWSKKQFIRVKYNHTNGEIGLNLNFRPQRVYQELAIWSWIKMHLI